MRVGPVVVACGLVLLAGCSGGVIGGNGTEGSQTPGVAGARLTGAVHGGQNPISGAHVYLFAAASGAGGAGQAGYGGSGIAASSSNASVSLLTSGFGTDAGGNTYVKTGSDGSFTITGDYTCAAGQQVYLYSVGGDPGLGTGVNPAAGLMAALGACPVAGTFPSGLYVVVNEVSTVAAAYAMAGFATDATHVGSSGTALALTGIANAFANAANLETLGTGVALATTPAGNGTVPQAEINTLANILAACVNSNGTGSACSTLFANAESSGTTGTVAADTATAAINIVHNPGVGTAALYGVVTGTSPFAPALTHWPNDWTIALIFTGGGLRPNQLLYANLGFPSGAIAVDGLGNIWIANPVSGSDVTELSSTGAPLSPSTGFTGGGLYYPQAIALDENGNAWIANGLSSLSELSSTGSAISPASGFAGGGLAYPVGVAIDGDGNAWVANGTTPGSVSELSSGGAAISPSQGYTGGGVSEATGIAIDGTGNAWVAVFDDFAGEFSKSGAPISGSGGFTGAGLNFQSAVAIDSSGDSWFANYGGNSVSKLSPAGQPLSPTTGFSSPGSMRYPQGIAVDGSGSIWVATGLSGISELTSAGMGILGNGGSLPIGFGGYLTGVAVDGSGDVWTLLGNGAFSDAPMEAVELIGVATPVITPIAAGLPATPTVDGSSNLGMRP